jgi:hypothetical protein
MDPGNFRACPNQKGPVLSERETGPFLDASSIMYSRSPAADGSSAGKEAGAKALLFAPEQSKNKQHVDSGP